ncbi:MAG: segregation/condensation protein A [Clostridiales bacterium]|nr:segregation/condensation protein A [Clostridiales bacterium]
METTISYKLDSFEGPMDLLLHLISKHKVSINDVPILDLVEQYLDYMRMMNEENLEIASEFLEMAARLVYIKTVSLLPVHEEAEKLTEELRGELTEYRDCQLVAGMLAEQANGFGYMSRKPQEFEPDLKYTRKHEPYEIYRAFISAVGKGKRRLPPPIEAFSGIIAHKIVSVASRVSFILDYLKTKPRQKLSKMFDSAESRSELVATFLAVLALIKAKRITAEGDGEDTVIQVQTKDEEWRQIDSE